MIRDQVRERIEGWKAEAGSNDVTDSDGEQMVLEESKDRLRWCMDEKRTAVGAQMSRAEYDEKTKTMMVTKFAGKLIKNMGHTVAGKRHLYPEEALFLMEAAALELIHNGIPLSLAQAHSLLIGDEGVSSNQYMTFSHLTRAGYFVVRYRVPILKTVESDATSSDSTTRKLSVVYDVHLGDSGYSMGKEKRPDHRLVIMGADDDSVSVDELRSLKAYVGDDVPFHAAVVDQGDVICFSLDWVAIPVVTSDSDL